MKIFDQHMNLIESPDLEKGKLEQSFREIVHRYEITQAEIGHYEVIKKYPNGGEDVKWVVDTPEEGRWITYDSENKEIEFDGIIPDDAPHEMELQDHEIFARYIPYTEEELAEKEEQLPPEPTIEQLKADIEFIAMMTGVDMEV